MQLYARVLLRWWPVVLIGLLVAVALTFLSIFRVDTNTGRLSARKATQYVSYATLFVTQQGFPSGRLGLAPAVEPGSNATTPTTTAPQPETQLADLSRLTSLAILYSHLASSDPVRAIMARQGPITGTIEAAALPATQNSSDVLPIISIAAITDSRDGAITLAGRASSALVSYIEQEQAQNGIPTLDRVKLTTLNHPDQAKVFAKPSTTLPVAVFLTVLIATIGMAFILENLRPRIRSAPGERVPNARSA